MPKNKNRNKLLSTIPRFNFNLNLGKGGPFDDPKLKDYLTREQITTFKNESNWRPFETVASNLFFEGGTLNQNGLNVKAEYNSKTLHEALRALLRSFEPPHDIKTMTVAFVLHETCTMREKIGT